MAQPEAVHVARPGVLSVTIRNKPSLYASYFPLLRNGGLFVPTNKSMKLGEPVLMLLTLLDDPAKYPVTGKIAWVTPANAHGNRPQGLGIQFADNESIKLLRKKIEGMLGGALHSSSKPTHTL
jgi:type IV pilus assembly protein PilZ